MPGLSGEEVKYLVLVFAIMFLGVFLVRKAVKKVRKDRTQSAPERKVQTVIQKPIMTSEQFEKGWKAFSWFLLLAAVGNLYMVYRAVVSAVNPGGLWVWWIDAGFSLLAAFALLAVWKTRAKIWVFFYFGLTLVPIFLFMSIKGAPFKVSALIHLFPLVLLYLALKPIWAGMKD